MNGLKKEIELRSEILPHEREGIDSKIFAKLSLSPSSFDDRISVIFLGSIKDKNFDVRIRINSKKYTELVLKCGDFHAHDRTEITEQIKPEQFMGFVRLFYTFGFACKVMRRTTKRFLSPEEEYEIALVDAGSISYLEIEKIIESEAVDTIQKEREKLQNILANIGLTPIDKKQFDGLCDRLTKKSDWVFSGSPEDYLRLESEISSFRSKY